MGPPGREGSPGKDVSVGILGAWLGLWGEGVQRQWKGLHCRTRGHPETSREVSTAVEHSGEFSGSVTCHLPARWSPGPLGSPRRPLDLDFVPDGSVPVPQSRSGALQNRASPVC